MHTRHTARVTLMAVAVAAEKWCNRGDEGNAGHVMGALALQYQTPSSITNSVDLLHH
jgi:hypothetical protein